MKKFMSVILSVVMLLSCVAVFAVGANAATTYPNGQTQTIRDWPSNEEIALHRISTSFYVDQDCFIAYGAVRYYDNFDPEGHDMTYDWLWSVYTTGTSGGEAYVGDAYTTGSKVCNYVNDVVDYKASITGTVTGIEVTYSVYDWNHLTTASTLTAEYSNS